MTIHSPYPITLIIFDGFGYRKQTKDNAIAKANTWHFDKLWASCPHCLIEGSGRYVGLPDNQMGNSEVGHLNLGAGRIVYQEFTRINRAIQSGQFFENRALITAINSAIKNQKAIHILGLLSPGGVHSHEKQLHAALKLAATRNAKQVYIHAFLDGRDTPPQSALASLQQLTTLCHHYGTGSIASLIGRYYAMDRDQRWQRTNIAYDLLTQGTAYRHAASAIEGLQQAYANKESDEFVKATSIHLPQQAPIIINDGDVVLFMNYRADRARQLTKAFIDKNFCVFKRKKWPTLDGFVTLTQYDANFKTPCAFPPIPLSNVLGEHLAKHGCKQLRLAETEKYAHVTFFFNGGIETPFQGEDRILVPSPNVATYDLQPQMSAPLLTDKLITAINSKRYHCIICNYANADMVGHTGNFAATLAAIECLDHCLGRIVEALKQVGGELLLTADHGNAEKMFDETTKQPHTAHTLEPVPFIYMGRKANIIDNHGALEDIAPTLLSLMALPLPKEMTGKPLINLTIKCKV